MTRLELIQTEIETLTDHVFTYLKPTFRTNQ